MNYFYLVPIASITALFFAYYFFKRMMRESEGTEKMKTIAGFIREGAMSYLKQQYKVVLIVFLILALVFTLMAYFGLQNNWVPFAFITGGFFSALAGFFGMKTATYASARTANAVQRSLNQGLKIAFRSGAVMGLVVVGLALLDISAWYLILDYFVEDADAGHKLIMITTTMLTFGMGASTQALFARVGGGIYTKAADVGADLVGKVEAGIPEDDPRNPATIADNVGDNVGDVAGMGADLYESFVATVLGCMILGLAVDAPTDLKIALCLLPLTLGAGGVIASILGMGLVRVGEGGSPQAALNKGTFTAAGLAALFSWPIFHFTLGGRTFGEGIGANNIFWATVIGVVGGTAIGLLTEYYTGTGRKPVNSIVKASETGAATNIITGMGVGMASTALPILVMAATVLLGYWQAGLFGVAIATLGVQLFLGIQLAVDAFGPIADNAGGLAEMSEQPPGV